MTSTLATPETLALNLTPATGGRLEKESLASGGKDKRDVEHSTHEDLMDPIA
jgi:hypothetical protein